MKQRRVVAYAAVAIVVAIGFWLGGYFYFVNSDDWLLAERQISMAPAVTNVVGKVERISPSPLGFFYRFSGDWAQANMRMQIAGDKTAGRFKVELEMVGGHWTVKGVKQL